MSAKCATFVLQAKVAQDGPTSFGGHVYTDKGDALPGVRVSIGRTALSGTRDASGKFEILNIPPGHIDLFLDGRTANAQGKLWPSLHFEAYAVRGQTNELAHGIYLPPLLSGSAKTVGGVADVILTIPGLDGFQMKVKANSVTFPDGSRVGTLIVSPVTADKLPMAPPAGGGRFGIPAWTIQPAGTRFDPPIEVTMPNGTSQPIGDNLPVVQWDHDLSMFVPMGRATVSEDGSILVTDAGSGITKAGWGALCVYDPNKCVQQSPPKCRDYEKSGSTPAGCPTCEKDTSKNEQSCIAGPNRGGAECGICENGFCETNRMAIFKNNTATCCGPEKKKDDYCCIKPPAKVSFKQFKRGLTFKEVNVQEGNVAYFDIIQPTDYPPVPFAGPPKSNFDTPYSPKTVNGVEHAIDGCSAPDAAKAFFPPGFFINKGTNPPQTSLNPLSEIYYDRCEAHDVCYQTCGSNQKVCDDALYDTLTSDCERIAPDLEGSDFYGISVPILKLGPLGFIQTGTFTYSKLSRRNECSLIKQKVFWPLRIPIFGGYKAHSGRQQEMCVVCAK